MFHHWRRARLCHSLALLSQAAALVIILGNKVAKCLEINRYKECGETGNWTGRLQDIQIRSLKIDVVDDGILEHVCSAVVRNEHLLTASHCLRRNLLICEGESECSKSSKSDAYFTHPKTQWSEKRQAFVYGVALIKKGVQRERRLMKKKKKTRVFHFRILDPGEGVPNSLMRFNSTIYSKDELTYCASAANRDKCPNSAAGLLIEFRCQQEDGPPVPKLIGIEAGTNTTCNNGKGRIFTRLEHFDPWIERTTCKKQDPASE